MELVPKPKPRITVVSSKPRTRMLIHSVESSHLKTMTVGRYPKDTHRPRIDCKSLLPRDNQLEALNNQSAGDSGFEPGHSRFSDPFWLNAWSYAVDVTEDSSRGSRRERPKSTGEERLNRTLMNTIDSHTDPELAMELDKLARQLGLLPNGHPKPSTRSRKMSNNLKSTGLPHDSPSIDCRPLCDDSTVTSNQHVSRLDNSVSRWSTSTSTRPLSTGAKSIRALFRQWSAKFHRSSSRRAPERAKEPVAKCDQQDASRSSQIRSSSIFRMLSLRLSKHRSPKSNVHLAKKFVAETPTPVPIVSSTRIDDDESVCADELEHLTQLYSCKEQQQQQQSLNCTQSDTRRSSQLFSFDLPSLLDPASNTSRTESSAPAPPYLNASVNAFGYGLKPDWKQFSISPSVRRQTLSRMTAAESTLSNPCTTRTADLVSCDWSCSIPELNQTETGSHLISMSTVLNKDDATSGDFTATAMFQEPDTNVSSLRNSFDSQLDLSVSSFQDDTKSNHTQTWSKESLDMAPYLIDTSCVKPEGDANSETVAYPSVFSTPITAIRSSTPPIKRRNSAAAVKERAAKQRLRLVTSDLSPHRSHSSEEICHEQRIFNDLPKHFAFPISRPRIQQQFLVPVQENATISSTAEKIRPPATEHSMNGNALADQDQANVLISVESHKVHRSSEEELECDTNLN